MLQPQDIFILIALANYDGRDWTYAALAVSLRVPTSQVFKGLSRAEHAQLFLKQSRTVVKRNLLEFLVHGVRYTFAVQPEAIARGVPADWRSPGLSGIMLSDEGGGRVWADPDGTVRGETIKPLHPSVPFVALDDPQLHALFALVDIARFGSARERAVAADELQRRLT